MLIDMTTYMTDTSQHASKTNYTKPDCQIEAKILTKLYR